MFLRLAYWTTSGTADFKYDRVLGRVWLSGPFRMLYVTHNLRYIW